MAHARRGDADEHLARARRVERERLDAQRRARLVQDGGADLHQAMRCASRRSRSGTTPRPGPGGGAIVPSAAISTRRRRAASRGGPASSPGGSSGTSRYGHVETAEREVQVRDEAEAVRPRVRGERAPAEVGERGDPPAPAEAAREHDVGLHDVDAAAQDEVARLGQAAHHLAGRDPQRGAAPQQGVALDVVGAQRLLEPVDAERLERAGALRRGRDVPARPRGRPPCASPGWRRP